MILEKLQQYTAEYPNAPILFDDAHSKGITYTQFDEMTGKVYAWLKEQGIGKEDFCPYKPSERNSMMRRMQFIHQEQQVIPKAFCMNTGIWSGLSTRSS